MAGGLKSHKRIALRTFRAKQILGVLPPQETYLDYFKSLDIQLIDSAKDRLLFSVPTSHLEIIREHDLVALIAECIDWNTVAFHNKSCL